LAHFKKILINKNNKKQQPFITGYFNGQAATLLASGPKATGPHKS